MTFEIERNTYSASNKGKIGVYNLDDASRANILSQQGPNSANGSQIQLAVGYGYNPLTPLNTIFNGFVWSVTNTRHGADLVTEFSVDENGGPALGAAIAQIPYPAGVTRQFLINALIALMPPVIPGPQLGIPANDPPYNKGGVLVGSVKANLDRIVTQELGLTWYILNNVLYINPAGQSPAPDIALVNESTGLIGTPNLTTPIGGAQTITFECLINRAVYPGCSVFLESRNNTAALYIRNITYIGDTHTSKWTQKCEGIPALQTRSIVT